MDNKKLLETLKEMLELAKSDPDALDKADIFDFKTKQKVASLPTDKLSPPRGQLKAVGTGKPTTVTKNPAKASSEDETVDNDLKSLISAYHNKIQPTKKLTPESMKLLAQHKEFKIRYNLSKRPKLTPEAINLLAQDKDWRVRASIAKHPNLTPELMNILARDEEPWVTDHLSEHPNLTPEARKILGLNKSQNCYQALEKGIKEKVAEFIALTKNQAQHQLASFWDELNRNDGAFYYAFSDDPHSAAQDRKTLDSLHLKAQALGPDAVKMLEGFHAYHQGRVTGKHVAKPEKPQLTQQQFGKSEEQNLNKANAQCPHCKGKAVTAVLNKFKMCKKCYGKKIKEQIKAKRAELLQNPKYREYLGDDKVEDATRAEAENPFRPKDVGSPQPSKDDEQPVSRLPGFIIRGR